MNKGQKVELRTFNGTSKTDENCNPNENYWKLIGSIGTVINFPEELNFPYKNRLLIQFDKDVKQLNLECHNNEPNSLWILISDLRII